MAVAYCIHNPGTSQKLDTEVTARHVSQLKFADWNTVASQ